MKTFLLSTAILALTLTSCRKDDDTPATPIVYPEESYLSNYISSSGFGQKTANYVNSGNYEFGVAFTPTVKGNLKAISVKIPDANSSLRVTIWDYNTKTVLRSEIINVTAANTVTTKSITPVALSKDTKYFISMNSGDWFNRTKTDNTATTYPITSGHITINEYAWISSLTTETKFPTNKDLTYYAGDLDFTFQQAD